MKLNKNQKGFSAVEFIMVFVIIVLIGAVGYFVYKNHHQPVKVVTITKSTQAKPTNTATTINPYAGWKTYTLPVEKLSFMYPSDWTLSSNPPSSTQDDALLTSSDGFSIDITDGQGNGGDPTPEVPASSAIPVKYIGKSDYLVLTYGIGSRGQGSSDGLINGAILQTSTDEGAGQDGGYSYPTDKYATQGSTQTGEGAPLPGDPTDYIVIECFLKTQIPLQQISGSSNFTDAELVISSMHY